MLHKCNQCKEQTIRERNGIRLSKLCKPCRDQKAAKKTLKHQATKGYAKARFKTLHKKAWILFSRWLRFSQAIDGWVRCYTCPTKILVPEAQAGHYFHGKLDFDTRNIHPQCSQCNLYKSGNLAYYGVKLAEELGVDGMQQLRLDSNTKIYTISDLEGIIEEYTKKLNEISPRTSS
jgi:hypothetical protein